MQRRHKSRRNAIVKQPAKPTQATRTAHMPAEHRAEPARERMLGMDCRALQNRPLRKRENKHIGVLRWSMAERARDKDLKKYRMDKRKLRENQEKNNGKTNELQNQLENLAETNQKRAKETTEFNPTEKP